MEINTIEINPNYHSQIIEAPFFAVSDLLNISQQIIASFENLPPDQVEIELQKNDIKNSDLEKGKKDKKDTNISVNLIDVHIHYADNQYLVEEIRNIVNQLTLKPQVLPINLHIILEGQKLTEIDQNTLLKIFEDMPSTSALVILSNNLNQLLPTLKSRAFITKIEAPKSDTSIPLEFQKLFNPQLTLYQKVQLIQNYLQNLKDQNLSPSDIKAKINLDLTNLSDDLTNRLEQNPKFYSQTIQKINTHIPLLTSNIPPQSILEDLFL